MKIFMDKSIVEEVDVPDEYIVDVISDKLNDLDEDEIRENVTKILAAAANGDIDDGLYDMVMSELDTIAYEFDKGIVGDEWYSYIIGDDINEVTLQQNFEMYILADKIVDMVKEEFGEN